MCVPKRFLRFHVLAIGVTKRKCNNVIYASHTEKTQNVFQSRRTRDESFGIWQNYTRPSTSSRVNCNGIVIKINPEHDMITAGDDKTYINFANFNSYIHTYIIIYPTRLCSRVVTVITCDVRAIRRTVRGRTRGVLDEIKLPLFRWNRIRTLYAAALAMTRKNYEVIRAHCTLVRRDRITTTAARRRVLDRGPTSAVYYVRLT